MESIWIKKLGLPLLIALSIGSMIGGGIFTYAKEGFGDLTGFNSAWSYWISAWTGMLHSLF